MWVKVAATGDPATAGPDELTFLAVDTRTPYTSDSDGADAGKTSHYMLCWVGTTGAKDPWSRRPRLPGCSCLDLRRRYDRRPWRGCWGYC